MEKFHFAQNVFKQKIQKQKRQEMVNNMVVFYHNFDKDFIREFYEFVLRKNINFVMIEGKKIPCLIDNEFVVVDSTKKFNIKNKSYEEIYQLIERYREKE